MKFISWNVNGFKRKKKRGNKAEPDSYLNLVTAILNLVIAILLLIEKLTE